MYYPGINTHNPLILASASPRRKQLLGQAGLPFRAIPSRVAEEIHDSSPEKTACLLAGKKALEIFPRAGGWVLGADTTVVVAAGALQPATKHSHTEEIILGKPRDAEDASRMLRFLSDREHRVITGFCLLDPSGESVHSEAVSTRVSIKKLSDQEINAYIRSDEPFGKAGSYAIQGIGSFMVKSIAGSYTNVVGLPLYALIKALIGVGALKSYPLSGLSLPKNLR